MSTIQHGARRPAPAQRQETPLDESSISGRSFRAEHLRNPHSAVAERNQIIMDAKQVVAKLLDGPLRAAPGEHSGIGQFIRQMSPSNHCGELSQDALDMIRDSIMKLRSPNPYTLYLEVSGKQGIGASNHARLLIGTKDGIIVVDPWKNEVTFHRSSPSGKVVIPNEFGPGGKHLYSVHVNSGTISIPTSDKAHPVEITNHGQSMSNRVRI